MTLLKNNFENNTSVAEAQQSLINQIIQELVRSAEVSLKSFACYCIFAKYMNHMVTGEEEASLYKRSLFIGDCSVGCSGVLNTVEMNSFPLDMKVKQIENLSWKICSMPTVWTKKLVGAQLISKHQHYIK